MIVLYLKSITYKLCTSYNVYYRPLIKRPILARAEQRGGALGLALRVQPDEKKSLFLPRYLRVRNSRKPTQRPGHNQAGLRLSAPIHSTSQNVIFYACLLSWGQRQAALQGFYRFLNKVYLLVNRKIEHLRTWQPAFFILSIDMLNVIQCLKFTRIFFAVNGEHYSAVFNAPGCNQKPASQRGRVCVYYVGRAGLGLAK